MPCAALISGVAGEMPLPAATVRLQEGMHGSDACSSPMPGGARLPPRTISYVAESLAVSVAARLAYASRRVRQVIHRFDPTEGLRRRIGRASPLCSRLPLGTAVACLYFLQFRRDDQALELNWRDNACFSAAIDAI